MKTLKSAAMQFLSDVRSNRCMILSYRDAIEGLGLNQQNRITRCYHKRDSRQTIAELTELISSLLEYVVILHSRDGYDVRTVFNHEDDALILFRDYVMNGKKVSLFVE